MSTETRNPTVLAWKDKDEPTWIVQVGEDVYEMSADAHMPNGVCQYCGPASDLAWTVRDQPVKMIPIGIVRQIVELLSR